MNFDKNFYELKESIQKETKIIKKINSFLDQEEDSNNEKKLIFSQIDTLKNSLREENANTSRILSDISLIKLLPQNKNQIKIPMLANEKLNNNQRIVSNNLSKRRLIMPTKKGGYTEEYRKKLIGHERLANKIFSSLSMHLLNKGRFKKLREDLIKANMKLLPKIYVSIIFFSTLLALIASIFILIFLSFFNLSFTFPFITQNSESMTTTFLKFFWILIAIPLGIFILTYFYPTLEKDSLGRKINQELPFATINMAAISGSLIDPTKIFSIIILTKEYPALEKEFTKIINSINVLGYDLITILRDSAFNSPSKKLANLFNGLATTINSGGDLSKFFEERAENLLFEYKLEQEKDIRSAGTFMDIYISIVIAAPMILMLLMMMIQISGFGVSLSMPTITLIMILSVSLINIAFLTFLHLKQPRN